MNKMQSTDTATYTVVYLDENSAEQKNTGYQSAESAAQSASEMALEGTIVLRITRN